MTSKHRRDIYKDLISNVEKAADEPVRVDGYSPIKSVYKIMRRAYWEDIEHLYEMLPIVWGLERSEFERLLRVPAGWLDAYRVHEVKPNEETWEKLCELLQLHLAMRMVVRPRGYAEWLRRTWTSESPIGAQSPLEFILNGGDEALKLLKQVCLAQTQ